MPLMDSESGSGLLKPVKLPTIPKNPKTRQPMIDENDADAGENIDTEGEFGLSPQSMEKAISHFHVTINEGSNRFSPVTRVVDLRD